MRNATIVIGANFGDEGKGLATDYFSTFKLIDGNKPLVVLHNGSCQRSHTVSLADGTRHAFQHFGSGTFAMADTYFSDTFIVNPIFFRKEYEIVEGLMKELNMTMPKIYINPECRVATPYDSFINQAVEESRGNNNHGSCGFGVFETVTRYKAQLPVMYHYKEYTELSFDDFLSDMRYIVNWSGYRLDFYGIKEISKDMFDLFSSKDLVSNFYDDLKFMIEHTTMIDNNEILNMYDSVIFEGGQGLALDEYNMDDYPHLTPSHTGSTNPYNLINNYEKEYGDIDKIEVAYITRTYFTRHGAGFLPNECEKDDINPDIVDFTNVPNPFQHSIRYGKMDVSILYDRIDKDYSMFKDKKNVSKSIFFTHCNYKKVGKEFDYEELIEFDNCYMSNGMTRESVRKLWW